MSKSLFLVAIALVLLSTTECNSVFKNIFHRATTTTTTTTTAAPATTKAPGLIIIYNRVPKAELGCHNVFECKKKLKSAPAPKPCVKYCLKRIECPNNVVMRGAPDQCFEYEEQAVHTELTAEAQKADFVPTMQVAMIDFPCQPNYLPDSRGRCREVW